MRDEKLEVYVKRDFLTHEFMTLHFVGGMLVSEISRFHRISL